MHIAQNRISVQSSPRVTDQTSLHEIQLFIDLSKNNSTLVRVSAGDKTPVTSHLPEQQAQRDDSSVTYGLDSHNSELCWLPQRVLTFSQQDGNKKQPNL